MPRLALWLLCGAYVLPGVFGRDPWRNADLTSFGYMLSLAEGRSSWLAPALGGVPTQEALLPYWIGALAIKALPFLEPALAARLPFALALLGVLMGIWYATLHLARTPAAQPVAFAFGGEAHAVDYARALADGAVLAAVATLGLLQLGHETTPQLFQLLGAACLLYGLACAPYRAGKAPAAVMGGLMVLAASGAPFVALLLAVGALIIHARSAFVEARRLLPWIIAGCLVALGLAGPLHGWQWRIGADWSAHTPGRILTLLGWFCWPTLPLALWTLWRWRRQSLRRHITVPLMMTLAALACCIAMGGDERALLLALPPLAVLASFALPTLKRSASAMLDWLSVFFFSALALFIWLYYASLQGVGPATLKANVMRLAPSYRAEFGWMAFAVAMLGTLAWLWLVRWRTARHRHALWKSLVLPAGGVTLGWTLLMTLWLHPLDYARSQRPLVGRMAALLPAGLACVAAPGAAPALVAALEVHGRWRVDARSANLLETSCHAAVLSQTQAAPPAAQWAHQATVRRPTDRRTGYELYVRRPQTALAHQIAD